MKYTKVTVYFLNGESHTINYVRQISSTEELHRFEHQYTNDKWEFNKSLVTLIHKET
ncbi:hypothetical protein SEA_TUNATARTARE_233 [Streptomyces phage TunaTartare]|jgi:hypothetical protein|uniref:Uncharacterized protein n=1 Tax=Streptomyces phage TunaTartare TaxID=2848887 RepID=A0A8F2E821_9CAUD|nr:hypothetical protein PP457_gp047 [Streptomyces phage TunaTartare]QWT30095.1 hypothetical protein SEA_TUNATARTARE_233 [Streptomyces phage TunaTartare]